MPPGSLSSALPTTALLGQFLVAINGFIRHSNETQLADYIALEPPFNNHYMQMIQELRQAFPKGNEDALEEKCTDVLTTARDGIDGSASWTPFIKLMVQYLGYLRDVDIDPNKYLETYGLLSELQVRANSALNHGTLGHLMLPVVVSCAKLVCRLAIGLDKQPELITHLKSNQAGGSAGEDDGGPRETLPERAANILRQAFVTCLNDRTSGLNRDGKPEGKKRGIYTIANLCLKILFQCRKTRNASQIFENIYNLSPPLAAYPKRERVTYLYYLGRFCFQNNHFYRAQLALQHAYDESPASPECVRQRRLILIFLITSNIILGRFPSATLLQRPEAEGLAERFGPIIQAICTGDLNTFRQHLDIERSPHADWFLHFRILLQLRNRAEVLVWRTLIRRTWILKGTRTDPNSRVGPLINISDLVAVFTVVEKQWQAYKGANSYTDPDFEGVDFDDEEEENALLPSTTTVESKLSSLIDQGLIRGFISHRQLKFVISGYKSTGGDALAAGFPSPWEVIKRKTNDEVPGWKVEKAGQVGMAGGVGPGMVVNLSNLRPVGLGS